MLPSTSERVWVPRPGGPRALRSWLARHQRPSNFYLHVVGIPMTLVALPSLFRRGWRPAAGLFLGGYAFQILGHAIEGAPPGELMVIKRLVSGGPPRSVESGGGHVTQEGGVAKGDGPAPVG